MLIKSSNQVTLHSYIIIIIIMEYDLTVTVLMFGFRGH